MRWWALQSGLGVERKARVGFRRDAARNDFKISSPKRTSKLIGDRLEQCWPVAGDRGWSATALSRDACIPGHLRRFENQDGLSWRPVECIPERREIAGVGDDFG